MSRARSVPAFIVANSAPWMNGTARAKARNESVGKPGSSVEGSSPAGVHEHQRDGEDERRDRHRRLADRAPDRAARDRADLGEGVPSAQPARRRLDGAHRRRGAAALRPPPRPRASGPSSRGRRRRGSARAARRRASATPSASIAANDVGEADALVEPDGELPVARAARRSGRAAPAIRGRSSSPAGIAWTLGRPISAFSAAGVPSATIRPWSMIPTRSASTSASSRYWVVRNTVTPSSRARRATSSQSAVRLCGSRPVVGSSRNRTRGRWTSASARSSRRFMPPE